jgi:hypothetical protein
MNAMKPNTRRRTRSILTGVVVAAVILLSSCEELLFEEVPDTSPQSVFTQVWDFTNREYSFFDYKGVDWNAVRDTYEPRIREDMNDEELFSVLADMLFELKDGHVNLVSDFDRSRNWQWYLDPPPNYDYSVLERNYFVNQDGRTIHQYVGDAFILRDFKDVGYIHYRSFGSSVRDEDMDYVIETFKDHNGLIIDVRDNGGGSLSNVYAIGDRLTDTKVKVAEQQAKNGPGQEDFAPSSAMYLEPREGKSTFTKPVIVLTNGLCYSATNYFVTAVRELDHVTTLGARTGGGGGVPAFTVLTNGWELRVSSTRLFTLDGFNVENGIDPDVSQQSTEAQLANGTDAILDTALDRLESSWVKP